MTQLLKATAMIFRINGKDKRMEVTIILFLIIAYFSLIFCLINIVVSLTNNLLLIPLTSLDSLLLLIFRVNIFLKSKDSASDIIFLYVQIKFNTKIKKILIIKKNINKINRSLKLKFFIFRKTQQD